MNDDLDRIHSIRMNKVKDIKIAGIEGDHNVVKTLRDTGLLIHIIQRYII